MFEQRSTDGVPASQRLSHWNDLVRGAYPGMEIASRGSTFGARLGLWDFGRVRLVRPCSSAAVISRMPKAVPADAQRQLLAHLVIFGRIEFAQYNRSVSLTAGDIVLCRPDEPYRFVATTPHELIVIEAEEAALRARLPYMGDIGARRIPAGLPGSRILAKYIEALWQEAKEPGLTPFAATYSGALLDMLAASLTPADPEQGRGQGALLRALLQRIEKAYADPDLSPSTLAQAMGVSLRTLQAAAAQAGTTITGMTLARRLTKAEQLLTAHPYLSVTDVALECGFDDPSYFARKFKQAYGDSPSRYRNAH